MNGYPSFYPRIALVAPSHVDCLDIVSATPPSFVQNCTKVCMYAWSCDSIISHWIILFILYFNCDQAALWMVFSVHLSVCLSVCLSVSLSVCHTFLTMFPSSYHDEIFRVITKDQGKAHAKGQGQRSTVKVTEVTTQLNRFRTVTPVWIHIWWWNDKYSWMLIRRGALFFSRSSIEFQGHTALKIIKFDPDWAFPDCNSSLNSPMATKCYTKLEVA